MYISVVAVDVIRMEAVKNPQMMTDKYTCSPMLNQHEKASVRALHEYMNVGRSWKYPFRIIFGGKSTETK